MPAVEWLEYEQIGISERSLEEAEGYRRGNDVLITEMRRILNDPKTVVTGGTGFASRDPTVLVEVQARCKVTGYTVQVECVLPNQSRDLTTYEAYSCGDPTASTWRMRGTYRIDPGPIFARVMKAPPPTQSEWNSNCVLAGSSEDLRILASFRQRNPMSGGRYCAYSPSTVPGQAPTITFREFQTVLCAGPKEITITKPAEFWPSCGFPTPALQQSGPVVAPRR